MAQITLGGNPINTLGDLPEQSEQAPEFTLVKDDMSRVTLEDFIGSRLILNVFPSVDTSVCAESVRKFNEKAGELDNTKVLCISRDLPFAQKRFCAAEGLEHVVMLSDYEDGNFGKRYRLEMTDGPFAHLHSRVVIVLNEEGKVIHKEQVGEIGEEPDYETALASLK
jgi:thiol peroxidase